MAVAGQFVAKQIIEICIEVATRHQSRVLTLKRSACRITRIGKQRFFGSLTFLIKSFKHIPRHKNFAPYLKLLRPVAIFQHQRYRPYRLHVGRHIVAMNAVATRHTSNQFAVFIGKRYRQTVIFQFTAYFKVFTVKPFLNAVIEVGHFLLAVCVSQRQHWIFMRNLRKLLINVAAHPLCRRIGVEHVLMTYLQFLQFLHHEVKLLVAYFRLVKHIILIIMFVQFLSELQYSLSFVCHKLKYILKTMQRKPATAIIVLAYI